MLSRTVENAQKKVEQQNFLARKRVLEYDDVMNEQRRVVYKYRREILEGRDMSDVARTEVGEVAERLVTEYTQGDVFEDWDLTGLQTQAGSIWPVARRPVAARPEHLEPARDHGPARRGRARGLRPPRGAVRLRADARARAPGPAADPRQPLARAPLRDGLPARGHPPARLRPDRPPGRLQERGLLDVRGAHARGLGGVRADDLPPRGQGRGRRGRGPAGLRAGRGRRHGTSTTPAAGPSSRRRSPKPRQGSGRRDRDRRRSGRRGHRQLGRRRAGRPDDGHGPQGRARQDRPQRPLLVRLRARSTRSATAPEPARRSRRRSGLPLPSPRPRPPAPRATR